MSDRPNPNELFKDHPGATLEPPCEPFWDCMNFATTECHGECENCDIRTEGRI